MLSEFMLMLEQPKVFVASLVAAGAFLADGLINPREWEDLTLKGLMLAAILYLVREIARLRTESDRLRTVSADRDRERDAEFKVLVRDNTDAMKGMLAAVSKQTEYFEQIARKSLDEQLNHNHKCHD